MKVIFHYYDESKTPRVIEDVARVDETGEFPKVYHIENGTMAITTALNIKRIEIDGDAGEIRQKRAVIDVPA